MVHIMMRFQRIKCLPALLLGLTHKLAFFCSLLLFFASSCLSLIWVPGATSHWDMPQVLPGLMTADWGEFHSCSCDWEKNTTECKKLVMKSNIKVCYQLFWNTRLISQMHWILWHIVPRILNILNDEDRDYSDFSGPQLNCCRRTTVRTDLLSRPCLPPSWPGCVNISGESIMSALLQ